MSDYPVVNMTTDALLTTTRSVRKRLDLTKPVPLGLIRECLEIAVQAPTSANMQNWSFIVVTDAEQRRAIADVYRRTKARSSAVPGGFRWMTCCISTGSEPRTAQASSGPGSETSVQAGSGRSRSALIRR
jgi:nitroreductase